MEKSRLVIDANEVLASRIGAHGVEPGDIEGLAERVKAAHRKVEAAREAGGLAFWSLPSDESGAAAAIEMGEKLRGRFEDVVVLGIGGSSLGAKAVLSGLGGPLRNLQDREQRGGPRLFFPDNSDPATFAALLDLLDPARTCFLAITKSGGTAETLSQLALVRPWLGEGWKERIIAVTDPAKGSLRRLVEAHGLASLPVPPAVGGRYSVLSAVGLLPIAAAGLDAKGLLQGAEAMRRRCEGDALLENPAWLLAGLHHLFDGRGRNIHVFFPYADALRDLGDWYVQLWAESLGKNERVGPTPVRAVGATDQHSMLQLLMEGPQDKLVTFLGLDRHPVDRTIPASFQGPDFDYLAGKSLGALIDAELQGTAAALAEAGRPSLRIRLPTLDAAAVGELLFLWEAATAFAGFLYEVDPFDQPGVEASKQLTQGLLGKEGAEAHADRLRARPPKDRAFIL